MKDLFILVGEFVGFFSVMFMFYVYFVVFAV
jgi:hypothetical protein